MPLEVIDASDRFLQKLDGVTDPRQKRRIVGETFIRVFEEFARGTRRPGSWSRAPSIPM
jgi:GMP synthase (glutamine-hydrolysing)